jgi:hypothetical protein
MGLGGFELGGIEMYLGSHLRKLLYWKVTTDNRLSQAWIALVFKVNEETPDFLFVLCGCPSMVVVYVFFDLAGATEY